MVHNQPHNDKVRQLHVVKMLIMESAKEVQDIFSLIKERVTSITFIADLESVSTIQHVLQQ